MQIKTFFFDLGNVLLHFSYNKMWRQIGQIGGWTPSELQKLALYESVLQPHEKGASSIQALLGKFQELSGEKIQEDVFKHAVGNMFIPNLRVIQLLKTLKKKGYQLILISNVGEIHFDFARKHYSFLKEFDHLVLSYQEKCMKPDTKIFEKALKLAKNHPSECFYIDDVSHFIHSATTLGIQGHIFTTSHDLEKRLLSLGALDYDELI